MRLSPTPCNNVACAPFARTLYSVPLYPAGEFDVPQVAEYDEKKHNFTFGVGGFQVSAHIHILGISTH